MSYENKLTNLVFKNKENSARTIMCFLFLSFLSLLLYIYILKKTPSMKCMNGMECNANPRDKKQKHKNQRTMVT